MPTNRPFFANFLAAFRAHSALSKASTSTSVTSPTGTGSQFSPLTTSASAARTIATSSTQKTTPAQNSVGATTAAMQANLSHARHSQPSTATSPTARSPPTASATAPNGFSQRAPQRRGSDSSSEGGFRDALGGEKWYVGGRTAGGEERYYRLGMVRKERSGDRLSMDRLSL
ncbi:hypothetical protein MMC07_002895 [Pseudocyphellaria aurata]|nr:hypothetical protein [Pseudocyphellaria aurata]